MHTVKGFGIVNKAEVYVFWELSCFLDDPTDVGNLISGSSAFSKTNLNIWKFTVHILLKPGLENFEHYFANVWNEFDIAFLQGWKQNWHFSSPLNTAEFSKFAGILSRALSQHHLLGFEIVQLEFHHLQVLFIMMLPKAHLTSHSRMSGSWWVIIVIIGSRRSFLFGFSVYSCHLFLISSASVRSIPFLSFIVPIFTWKFPWYL